MRGFDLPVYDLGIRLYGLGISGASLFNKKAQQWVEGRKGWKENARKIDAKKGKRIWVHCASLGEFEQARPLIEKIKAEVPNTVIILTFFSPSGYEIRKDYPVADLVLYLPLDTKGNAQEFLDLIKPELALFVKYEFWFHYLNELKQLKIPAILFSSVFRKEQIFFRPYGHLFREILGMFSKIFVQSEDSKKLLATLGIESEVAYDTRFDRVYQISKDKKTFPAIEKFKTGSKVFIAGSTWHNDEELIFRCIHEPVLKGYKYIIAPHQIEKNRIEELRKKIKARTTLFSELTEANAAETDVVLIDNIGNLSSLYAYGDIAYVGGGFNTGVHNVLEAAVYGMPVIFGPKYLKALEAIELKKDFAAFDIKSYQELKYTLESLTVGDQRREMYAALRAKQYVKARLGGTNTVFDYLQPLLIKNPQVSA
jgi:3-deoxy-D-manno-octulosonic-acid transferase